jgi:hypothetical protein
VKITVERCDEFLVAVPQIFDRVKSLALWSAIKGYDSAAISGVSKFFYNRRYFLNFRRYLKN